MNKAGRIDRFQGNSNPETPYIPQITALAVTMSYFDKYVQVCCVTQYDNSIWPKYPSSS